MKTFRQKMSEQDRSLVLKIQDIYTDDSALSTEIVNFLNLLVENIDQLQFYDRGVALDMFLKWKTFLFTQFGLSYEHDIFKHLTTTPLALNDFSRLKKYVLNTNIRRLDGWVIDRIEHCLSFEDILDVINELAERTDEIVFLNILSSVLHFTLNNVVDKDNSDIQEFQKNIDILSRSIHDKNTYTYTSKIDYALASENG